MRRAASSAVRLLSRELQAEGVSSTRQFSKIAARVTTCAPSLFGSSSQSRTASPVETGNWRSTRHFSDIEAYSGIFYPDNECEVGGPAPEFKAPGIRFFLMNCLATNLTHHLSSQGLVRVCLQLLLMVTLRIFRWATTGANTSFFSGKRAHCELPGTFSLPYEGFHLLLIAVDELFQHQNVNKTFFRHY